MSNFILMNLGSSTFDPLLGSGTLIWEWIDIGLKKFVIFLRRVFKKINFIFILLNNSIYHSLIIYRTTVWGNSCVTFLNEKNLANNFLDMYAFSHSFSWVSVDVQLALKGTYIKKHPFFKKIILVIIFIVLFLAIKNDFAPLYLGILGIAIVSWVTTPNETR